MQHWYARYIYVHRVYLYDDNSLQSNHGDIPEHEGSLSMLLRSPNPTCEVCSEQMLRPIEHPNPGHESDACSTGWAGVGGRGCPVETPRRSWRSRVSRTSTGSRSHDLTWYRASRLRAILPGNHPPGLRQWIYTLGADPRRRNRLPNRAFGVISSDQDETRTKRLKHRVGTGDLRLSMRVDAHFRQQI